MTRRAADDTLVCCAYDGSVNAHWVARYAVHLAAATPDRIARFVHVRDPHISGALLERKLDHLLGECARERVEATVHTVQRTGRVVDALLEAVPAGRGTFLLCGTRARARAGGLLAGTVSEALLRRAPCNVLALRVVAPGLLGAPRRVLLPVAGHPGEGRDAGRFLALLAGGLESLLLLRVMTMGERVARHAPPDAMARLRAHGRAAVTFAETELRRVLPLQDLHVDALVRVAESWPRAARVAAGQYKCELVLAGVPGPRQTAAAEDLLANAPCDVGLYRAV